MQIIRDSFALDMALSLWVANEERVALVPTMGALHAGHLALVDRARELADRVVVSIFVNPTQFNDPADLERYPRQEESDLASLEAAGCDLAWLPAAADIYPQGFSTKVSVSGVSERWEGEHRPGHFDGVATVVAKLLTATMPDMAIFGEKDFQQLAVIRRMTIDLGLPTDIVGHPTMRESDRVAMSSRNVLLSAEERARAATIPQALEAARDSILAGATVGASLGIGMAMLEAAEFRIDYFALVDSATLEPLDSPAGDMRLIAAATIGRTRLIDNIAV